ncbi:MULTISPECIES: DUF2516 family protein [Paenarthrobacter]|uniref:DUF2516 family protein n=1 Tax=Paenarthrobacter TaxID=1742992 RepID=UPI00074D3811|nr:DUF2516 family protein [Paenarthrobacter ureafaciens]AMB39428.1 hypothetical protein AUT26_03770 [Arthrobacter sp. ATCC 21022]KUR64724.1 membrane protein [Arthrobacter sp. ATCC 21022]RWW95658.1 DUF2516 family protein [Paenarthrobacter ureafaciens]
MDGKYLIGIVTSGVYFILGLVALALEVWAFVDCLRHRPTLFVAASKRTKTFWTALTGIAFAIGALSLLGGGGGLGLFGIAAVTAACVYLADVRPAVREAGSGGSRNVGPYGPW